MFGRRGPSVWISSLLCIFVVGACNGAAAGSRPPISPGRYVAVVCGAVLGWKGTLEIDLSNLVSDVSVVRTSAERQLVANYFNGMLRDTNAVISRIQAAGPPAMANGDQVQTNVVRILETMRSALMQAEGLAVNGPGAVVMKVELAVAAKVSAVTSQINNNGATLSDPASSTSDCQKLFGRVNPVDLSA